MKSHLKTSPQLVVLSVLIAVAVFLVDIAVPLGVAGGVPYVAVVLVSLWSPSRRFIIAVAFACSVLTILGYFYSPAGGEVWKVLANRSLAVMAVWVTAVLGLGRSRAEEDLIMSEERFREMAENTDEVFWMMPVSLDEMLYISPAYEKIWGRTCASLYKDPGSWLDAVVEEDRERVRSPFRRVATDGFNQEYRIQRPDGSARWIRDEAFPVKNARGEVYRIAGFARDITERKRAEEELIKSEKNLAKSQQIAGIGGFELDIATGKVTWSEQMYRLFGFEVNEVTPTFELVKGLIHPDDVDRWLEVNERTINEHKPYYNEYRIVRKDKEVRIVHSKAELQFDAGGRPVRMVGTAQDITERKRAGEELRRVSTRLAATLEAVPDIVMEVDKYKVYTWANRAGLEFFGDDVIGREASYYFEGEQETYRLVEPLFEGSEDVIYVESWQRRKDGEKCLLAWWCRVLKDADGNVSGAISTARDVTERKRAEEELRESKQLLESTFSSLQDAIVIVDAETIKIHDCNEAATRVFGYSRDEMLGRETAFLHVDADSLEEFSGHLYSAVEEKGFLGHLEFRMKRKDGTVFPTEHSVMPLYDESGGRTAWVSVVRDITERKRLEDELLKAQKLESVGILAGGIAHDFNNLLTGITGNISLARMLSMSPGTPESYEKLSKILEKAEKASSMARNLTQKLLTFSEGGAPVRKKVHISNLLEDSVTFALSGSSVRCDCDVPDDLWPALVDEGQISQVIQNIVVNAVHAMPGGGVIEGVAENVTFDKSEGAVSEGLLDEGRYIRISIKDHGTGIAEENLAMIFDPYFTTKEAGSGLGLATSYSIVEKHGGLITVESEVGEGATFRIYLPAAYEEAPGEEAPGEESPSDGPGPEAGRVLVMDDEEIVREVAREALSMAGYEAFLAKDSDEAVRLYKEAMESGAPFDAVILDLTVPGGEGGRETIERLLRMDPGVKAIVSSGYSNDPVMADYKKYGFKAVLAKPYKMGVLKDVVRSVIAGG